MTSGPEARPAEFSNPAHTSSPSGREETSSKFARHGEDRSAARRALRLWIPALLIVSVAVAEISAARPSRLRGEVDAAGLRRVLAGEKGRVVLLNFWATWCVPCREEFPELDRLQAAHRGRGLAVIGISTDFASQRQAVEDFLRKLHPSFPVYIKKPGGDDQQFIDAVERSWGGELPFTVLYDRSGKKAKVLSGKHSYAEYEKEIQRLLRR